MGKITQVGDFENQNQYKTVILKIKVITNYEFFKSKSSQNQVILIIFKITFELWVFKLHIISF